MLMRLMISLGPRRGDFMNPFARRVLLVASVMAVALAAAWLVGISYVLTD